MGESILNGKSILGVGGQFDVSSHFGRRDSWDLPKVLA